MMTDIAANFEANLKGAASKKLFYHLYVCPDGTCLAAANPVPGSWHQRGVYLSTDKPRSDVRCPGCKGKMVIGRNGLTADGKVHSDGHISVDRDGNAVLHGEPIIQPANSGAVDQTADIDAEAESAS